jgi:hypothetical protein
LLKNHRKEDYEKPRTVRKEIVVQIINAMLMKNHPSRTL